MDTTDMDFHNDNLQKRDKLRDQVQVSKNLVGEMKNLRSVFKKHLDTISKEEKPDSNTEKLLKELNKEIETLKRTTRVMSNMQRHNIKRAEEYKETVPTKVSKDEDGKIKTITAPTKEDREKQEEFSRRSTNQISDMDRRLKSTLDVLANAKEKLSELTELNKKEEKPKEKVVEERHETIGRVPIREKPTKGRKGEEDTRSEKTTPPAWLKFFGKTISTTMGSAFKVALLPVTMGFKTITGILSGFWNSYLMSMVKTVALIGAIIYAIDWFQISAYKWGKEMGSSMESFTSENGAWFKTMTSLTNLVDSIGQFFGTRGDGSIDVTLNDIFINAGHLLINFMEEAWRNLLAWIYNYLEMDGGGYDSRSIYLDGREKDGITRPENVKAHDYQSAIDSYKTIENKKFIMASSDLEIYGGLDRNLSNREIAEGRGVDDRVSKKITEHLASFLEMQGYEPLDALYEAEHNIDLRENIIGDWKRVSDRLIENIQQSGKEVGILEFISIYDQARSGMEKLYRSRGGDLVDDIDNIISSGKMTGRFRYAEETAENIYQRGTPNSTVGSIYYREIERQRKNSQELLNGNKLEYRDDEAIKLNDQLIQSSLDLSQSKIYRPKSESEEPKSNNNVLINNKNNHFTSSIVPPAVLPEYGSPNRSFRMS